MGTCPKMAAVPGVGTHKADRPVSRALAVFCGGFATLHLNRPIIRFLSMCSRRAAL